MAEMTIRLETDPNTGKKNIIVGLKSDADALPGLPTGDDVRRTF